MNGIEIVKSEKLEDWEAILKRWIDELDRTLELTAGLEAPYVHGEHGNTHHFAVSAAIEGYACIREVMGKRNGHPARLDLALVSKRYLDIVESKWWEFNLLSLPSALNISEKVKNSCSDALSYSNDEGLYFDTDKEIRRIGITFFTPHYAESESFDESRVSDLLLFIKSAASPDILAWSFPLKTRRMKYWHRRYPGVIAVIKLTK